MTIRSAKGVSALQPTRANPLSGAHTGVSAPIEAFASDLRWKRGDGESFVKQNLGREVVGSDFET